MGAGMEATTSGDGANLGARGRQPRESGYSLWIWTGFALSIAATAVVGCMGYLHAKGLMALAIVGGSIASLLLLAFAGAFIYRMLQALRKSLEELASSQARLAEHDQLGAAGFRTLLQASPEAMIISNPHGEIIIMNSRAEQLFGYQREELLGQPIEVLLPERFRKAHLGHREGYNARPVNRPIGAARGLVGLRKDGTEFPIEVSLCPVETGQGILVSSAIVDITARKAAERELEERREALARSNRGARTVRLCRVARPAGAAADGRELRAASRPALPGQTRRRRR